MNPNKFTRWISLLTFAFLVGCAAIPSDRPGLSPGNSTSEASPVTGEKEVPGPAAENPAVVAAVADLSKRLGVEADTISVVEIEAVTWPDASLGCPEPGMAYIQILSPGYRVVLMIDGTEYVYHTDERENAVLCEENDMQNPSDGAPEIETGLELLVEQATEMLSEKLGIGTSMIEVLEARSIVWSDASLGCPQPDMRYLQVPKEGALIRLEALGQEFSYHIGEGRDLFLCEPAVPSTKPASPNLDPEFPTPGGANS